VSTFAHPLPIRRSITIFIAFDLSFSFASFVFACAEPFDATFKPLRRISTYLLKRHFDYPSTAIACPSLRHAIKRCLDQQ
jgi:hypothetical protein